MSGIIKTDNEMKTFNRFDWLSEGESLNKIPKANE